MPAPTHESLQQAKKPLEGEGVKSSEAFIHEQRELAREFHSSLHAALIVREGEEPSAKVKRTKLAKALHAFSKIDRKYYIQQTNNTSFFLPNLLQRLRENGEQKLISEILTELDDTAYVTMADYHKARVKGEQKGGKVRLSDGEIRHEIMRGIQEDMEKGVDKMAVFRKQVEAWM